MGARAAPRSRAPRIPSRFVPIVVSCAIIAAIWLIALSQWIVADSVVPWDSKNQSYAFFRFLSNALHSGAMPFWNPYHYGGHPSVADPQSLIFAPAFILWAWFDPDPSIRAFDILVYAHLLAGGLAVAAVGWRAGWPVAACVLAACIFMFGGAASGRLQHTGMILSYALFPLALLLLQLALSRRSIVLGLAFSAVAGSLALGRNQVALLLCFVLIAVAITEIVSAQKPMAYLRARMPVFAVMALTGLALIAVPMLLTMQFTALSNRPDVLLESALQGSLHPANLATLFSANVFGSHAVNYWGPGWRMPEIQFTDQSFNYLFVGAVPVLLVAWFGIAGGGLFRRGRLLLTGVTAVALLYMLGRYTPAFALFYEFVPGVSLFRRPVDASFVFLAAFALLCGYLLSDFIREGFPRIAVWRALTVIGAVAAIAILAFLISRDMEQGRSAIVAMLEQSHVLILAAIVFVLAGHKRARPFAAMLLAAIATGELLRWNVASPLNAESRAIYTVLDRPSEEDAKVLELLDREIAERQRNGEYPRVEIMGVGAAWQNLAMVRGWESTNGYNPLRIGYYDRLVAPGEATFAPSLRRFPASFETYDCALARALGLGYLVFDRPIEQVPRLAKIPVAEVLSAGPKLWVYRLKDSMPRVTFTSRVMVADADAVNLNGQLLFNPSLDHVLIDDDTPPAPGYDLATVSGKGRAAITSMQPGRIEIDAQSEMGGMLALHALYYPGWVAEIDGKPAPVLRADVLFRGVEVPPGQHRVVFRYAPFTLDNLSNALRTALNRTQ
ncbi:MAG TPA: hypothetical protein VJL90_07370 [Pseudorhodoplanes sp.]|nr:hypothetical protein [Pseudorhodoplanes sp.]